MACRVTDPFLGGAPGPAAQLRGWFVKGPDPQGGSERRALRQESTEQT